MTTTRANVLTVAFDHGRRTRTRIYTGPLRYGFTWDRLVVTTASGVNHEHDRWNIAGVEATNDHATAAA